ncbi:unnamed protein product [Prorocentrum cordatum]|uniref:EF-hand domain-containing protein n=1 Tax=Prorocentrum cordatum TaxID=2364126 RepID=A0ABN9PT08_9DINO|nr:unnamed protein product [Polarella glacialis]
MPRAATPCYEAGVPAREWLRCIFKLYDVSAEGFMDVGELVQVLQNATFVRMSKSELEKVARNMDYEGDGSVSWSDFESIMAAKLHLVNPGAPLVGQKAAQVAATYNRLKMLTSGGREQGASSRRDGGFRSRSSLEEGDCGDAGLAEAVPVPPNEGRSFQPPQMPEPPAGLPSAEPLERCAGARGGALKRVGARPPELKPAIAAAAWLQHR